MHSIGIGTKDLLADCVDASTQGVPPQLELSSFLQDLCLGAVSSPVSRAPVSVLSPNFQRYLDVGATATSPPPAPRIAVCRGTSTRDEEHFMDVAVDAVCDREDKAVQAVVEYCDVGTEYDPPAETTPVVSALDDAVSGIDLVASGPTSLTSFESFVDPPDDFTVDGSLAARSESDDAGPALETGPEETSPMGPSLIDSDDEPIASRLPGYLNSFKTCEVFALRFISFIFLFHIFSFHFHEQFRFSVVSSIFHRFRSFVSRVLHVFCFSSFSHRLDFFKNGCFSPFSFQSFFAIFFSFSSCEFSFEF